MTFREKPSSFSQRTTVVTDTRRLGADFSDLQKFLQTLQRRDEEENENLRAQD